MTQQVGFENYSDLDLNEPSGKQNLVLFKFPTEESPIICKLIPDIMGPKTGGKMMSYWHVTEHTHVVGINKRTQEPLKHTHPCQKTLGKKFCPECNAYYELSKELDRIGKESPDGKKLKFIVDLLKPVQKGWVYFVTPDANVVKAMKMPKAIINQLWGKAKTKWTSEVPSLIEEMRKSGLSPFDLKSPIGWLKMYKTGEGPFGTKYIVEEAKTEEIVMKNGRPVGKTSIYIENQVSDYVVKSYPLDQLPNFRDLEFTNEFTYEESEAFAENPRVTPERILEKVKSDYDEEATEPDATQTVASAELGMAAMMNEVSANTATLGEIDALL